MAVNLGPIQPMRKTGKERFHAASREETFDVLDFWQWSASNLLSNVTRGVLAEYLVAKALGGDLDTRIEWDACDLHWQGISIEVKSAAYIQSWHQNQHSKIVFNVRASRKWDATTNRIQNHRSRSADVYVFALLAHKDQGTIDAMDLSQWEFFVLATRVLNERKRSQHSITLASLRKLTNCVAFNGIPNAITQATSKLAS